MRRVYYLGVITTFLALAGMADAVTGHGSYGASVVWFIIGFIMVLLGYAK